MGVGEIIRIRRERLGITQADLSRDVGISNYKNCKNDLKICKRLT